LRLNPGIEAQKSFSVCVIVVVVAKPVMGLIVRVGGDDVDVLVTLGDEPFGVELALFGVPREVTCQLYIC